MSDIQVSVVASAIRSKWWPRLADSLKGNKINWEIVFVGNVPPPKDIPGLRWIEANVKPCQCYEIGFREARGELIHWAADDAVYKYKNQDNNLDIAYDFYKKFNDYKTMVAMRPIEDGGDVWKFHHFFGGWEHTPTMAPWGLMSKQFLHELGGYDTRFVSGQSENDLVMRGLEAGGRVEVCLNSYVYVDHRTVHPRENKFRKYYDDDRKFLERCWVEGGHGAYVNKGKGKKDVKIFDKRQVPLSPYKDENIKTISQGPKGNNPPWN